MAPVDEASILAPTSAQIDLSALRHNVAVVRNLAGDAGIIGVIKADAYGHGALPVAMELVAAGVDRLAVATVSEGIRLRRAGIRARILVLSPVIPGTLPAYSSHQLGVTVSAIEVAEEVAAFAGPDRPLETHLMIETGMGRIGTRIPQVERAVRLLTTTRGVELESIWTHLATADDLNPDYTTIQLERFSEAIRSVRDAVRFTHVANSAALINHRHMLGLDEHTLVRPGISLYGLSPSPELDQAASAGLRPVMRLRSVVGQVKVVNEGESISYARRWIAPGKRVIATIGVGYADGYPRNLTNRGHIGIGGHLYPVAGTVCMDMTMLDAGEPGAAPPISPGDEAVIFGTGGPSCFQVAHAAGTISYELTCRVGPRVPREYLNASTSM